jgi:hypothetical protein
MLGAKNVDQGLIEHHASVERRVALGLAGNNRSVPDPIGDAIRRPIPTEIPNVAVQLTRVSGGYAATVREHVEVNVKTIEDDRLELEVNLIIDPGNEQNAEMYLKSGLRKAGIKDDEVLDRICADTLPRLELRSGPTTIAVPVKKNEGGHVLGMTKIAYEMAHHWLGDAWLDDPIAVNMRRGPSRRQGRRRAVQNRGRNLDGSAPRDGRPGHAVRGSPARLRPDPHADHDALPDGRSPLRGDLAPRCLLRDVSHNEQRRCLCPARVRRGRHGRAASSVQRVQDCDAGLTSLQLGSALKKRKLLYAKVVWLVKSA